MAKKWKGPALLDQNEQKVFAALSNPKWDFRTLAGISRETGLPESEVRDILKKYPQWIRQSIVPDRQGRELFTLRSNSIKLLEYLAQARMFLAG